MPTITIDDAVEIFYKDWGSGQPIVFHHGWPLSAESQFYLDVASGPFYGFNREGVDAQLGVICNWWRQGMSGGAKAHYDGVAAFSETDFTDDLRAMGVATLVMHGDDDQVVPSSGSAERSIEVLTQGTLKVYPGLSHGMCVVNAEEINADLLEFIRD